MNLRIASTRSHPLVKKEKKKSAIGIFDRIVLNLHINLGRIDTHMMNVPVREYRTF